MNRLRELPTTKLYLKSKRLIEFKQYFKSNKSFIMETIN